MFAALSQWKIHNAEVKAQKEAAPAVFKLDYAREVKPARGVPTL